MKKMLLFTLMLLFVFAIPAKASTGVFVPGEFSGMLPKDKKIVDKKTRKYQKAIEKLDKAQCKVLKAQNRMQTHPSAKNQAALNRAQNAYDRAKCKMEKARIAYEKACRKAERNFTKHLKKKKK